MLSYPGELPTLCFPFSFANLSFLLLIWREKEAGSWFFPKSPCSPYFLVVESSADEGCVDWLWGPGAKSDCFCFKWRVPSISWEPESREARLLPEATKNEWQGFIIYFFTAVTFTSKSYLSVGWFCTQPWGVTFTTSILYSLYHNDSGLSYLPNGLKILRVRKMKIVVVYNIL